MTTPTPDISFGLHTGNSYDNFEKYKFEDYEYGLPRYRGMFMHKHNGYIAFSYNGNRIAEFHKNGDVYLIIPKNMTTGVSTRFNSMLSNCEIQIYKNTKVNGVRNYKCTLYGINPAASWRDPSRKFTITEFNAYGKILIRNTFDNGLLKKAEFICGDDSVPIVKKDNAKYKDFNKALKQIKINLIAQVRMGALTYNPKDSRWSSIKQDLLNKYFDGQSYPQVSNMESVLDLLIEQWMQSGADKQRSADIFALMLRLHGSGSNDPMQSAIKRINNACKAIQGRYLRRECLTIHDSNNSMSLNNEHNSNGELLASD